MEKLNNGMTRAAAVVTTAMVLVVSGATLAGATPAGSAGATAVDGQFDALVNDITTVYIPALLGLVVLGIGIRMGIKWLSKGASKA